MTPLSPPVRGPGETRAQYALRIARTPLRRAGFDLRRVSDPNRRQTLDQAMEHLRDSGMRPATVIDVGVATGTPELYRAFPDAYYLLIDALAEHEPHLVAILEHLQGEYALVAAAAEPGTVEFNVSDDPADSWNSTVFRTHDGTVDGWRPRTVPAARIDDLVDERGLKPPFVVKADIEGAELDALRGAARTLEQTLAVILEVGIADHFVGAPRIAEVVRFMDERGFATYDIVGGYNDASTGALELVEMVFVPRPRERG